MIKHFALLFVFAGVLSGCKKDKEDALAITVENLLGKYVLASVEASEPDKVDKVLLSCQKDDDLELLANNVMKIYDMGTECVPESNWEGYWQLKEDNYISFGIYEGPIKKLTGKTMVISGKYIVGFDLVDIKYTFNRK